MLIIYRNNTHFNMYVLRNHGNCYIFRFAISQNVMLTKYSPQLGQNIHTERNFVSNFASANIII